MAADRQPRRSDGSVAVHQDLDIFVARLRAGEAITYAPRPGRHVWLQVARGAVAINNSQLEAGDGAAIAEEVQSSSPRARTPSCCCSTWHRWNDPRHSR